jgi:predicted anti-sigma-YlaC factor YlaD
MGLCVAALLAGAGCSTKKFMADRLGDALAGSGTSFASDNDPELIRDASAFSLKLMESVLTQAPEHRPLLLAAASGFTQYGYAFAQLDADQTEDRDLSAARAKRERARLLYLRARDYGLRGLNAQYRGFEAALRANPHQAVAQVGCKDVGLLYWTAASWGAAISLSKDKPETVADLPLVEALADRALVLNEKFNNGAIHGFLIAFETARPGLTKAEGLARARKHFDRVVELTGGQSASPFVSLAEQVSVATQDRQEFQRLLERALAVNVDARPEWRLENVIMQRRARWLLGKVDDLFAE